LHHRRCTGVARLGEELWIEAGEGGGGRAAVAVSVEHGNNTRHVITLCITHQLCWREREKEIPPHCSSCALHPQQTPKVFPPPSLDHESKFRDQVSCFLQTFRPSFLLSTNFQIKIVFFSQKSSRARFSVFYKFLEQFFFLVFCKLFPEQVVFIFPLKFFSRASSFCCLQIISRAILFFLFSAIDKL